MVSMRQPSFSGTSRISREAYMSGSVSASSCNSPGRLGGDGHAATAVIPRQARYVRADGTW